MIPAPFDTWAPLDAWHFETLLGAGGQGMTFKATGDGEVAAVKCLRLGGELSERRVRREAEVLAELDHASIPTLTEHAKATDPDDQPWFFLIQEFISGESLQHRIDQGMTLSDAEARTFLRRMLRTLAHLHGQEPPVLHRDIKPANIILRDNDHPVLVDYGAAGHLTDIESGDALIGTTGYLPPEQYFGEPVPASDLYGLGATVLHAVSHRHPSEFPADGLTIRFDRRTSLPEDLRQFLATALSPDPDDRFANAEDALDSLDRRAGALTRTDEMPHATIEESPSALSVTTRSRPTMTRSRRGFLLIAGLSAVTSFAGVQGPVRFSVFAIMMGFLAACFSFFTPDGLGGYEWYTSELTIEDGTLTLKRSGPLGLWTDTTEIDDLEGLTLVETRTATRLSHYGGDLGPLAHNLLPSENETIRRRLEDWSERD
jgi:serine/threonine protein kinase